MVHSKQNRGQHKSPPAAHLGLESFRTPPTDDGLSLDKLKGAFATMLGAGDDPYSVPADPSEDPLRTAIVLEEVANDEANRSQEGCEINPRNILEAMLFVGLPDGKPLVAKQVAGLMRGVRAAEIDDLVRDLNKDYAVARRPYCITSEGSGYRLALRTEFAGIRDKFAGRAAQARLSAAAIEVLAVVAYNQPIAGEEVSRMRDAPSGRILSQLVRRQLLRVERSSEVGNSVARYSTTDRFLRLVGVESLADLPRNLDLDRQ